jgi:hypothetical protein
MIEMSFKCTILGQKNSLPYFETPLPDMLEVTKTEKSSEWTYKLPKIRDRDPNDTVKLSV